MPTFKSGSFRLSRRSVGIVAVAGTIAAVAQAQPGAKPAQTASSPSPPASRAGCVVSGQTPVPTDTLVYDQRAGGTAFAKLTGARIPLALAGFPVAQGTRAHAGRVEVQTSTGRAVRIQGWVELPKIRLFAKRDVPLAGRSVWLTRGQPLHVIGQVQNGLKVVHHVLGTADHKLVATIPCDAAQLELPTMVSPDPPRGARAYQTKGDRITIYDSPGGNAVLELELEQGVHKMFWSDKGRRGFRHVISRADITIDAWVKSSSLSFLPHGELFDLEALQAKPLTERTLALKDPPALRTATSDMPIHRRPENSLTAIGMVESGARFFPMEQVGDWTNVMPEGLGVLPLADKGAGFWVRTASIPQP